MGYGTYEEAVEKFDWNVVPDDYNLVWDTVQKHEDMSKPALYYGDASGPRETYTFGDLDRLSNCFANALEELGVGWEDRVGIMVSQRPENGIAHLANWKLGAISVLVPTLLGEEMVKYRIKDSSAKTVVVEKSSLETVLNVAEECPDLEHIIAVGTEDSSEEVHQYDSLVKKQPEEFSMADVGPDTKAFLMYTSGTTGKPKGVLQTHDFIAGAHSQVYLASDRDMTSDDVVYWMVGDWNWVAGPIMVLAAWHSGRPFVASPTGEFDPEEAFEILESFDVTTPWLPPTALRMMQNVEAPTDDLSLKGIISSGAVVTSEVVEWADSALGVDIAEAYGQTEFAPIMVNCPSWFDRKEGSLGRPIPGNEVAILDPETGEPLPDGEVGEIAANRHDNPAIFERYWKRPEKTKEVRRGKWHLTDDLGWRDEDGYYYFESRKDNVIITSGYRVGPEEVEAAILEHQNVEDVGIIGAPDETRGTIIKAYVQPMPSVEGSDALREEIRNKVRDDLAKYEYPREIAFIDELPKTASGKVERTALEELDEKGD